MLLDPDQTPTLPRTPPRPRHARPWMTLLSALLDLAGRKGELVSHSERAWASATFSGARHRVVLRFADEAAIAAGEAFIDCLPEHEFTLPGQIVADAAVIAVEHHAPPEAWLSVEVELLLLDDR